MATTLEVGKGLMALISENKLAEAINTYYADNITSTEPMGENPVVTGVDAVKGKMDYFHNMFDIHGLECSGPFACQDQFVLEMSLDATNKQSGEKTIMHEMALYTVKDGKIVDEKFFYDMK